MPAYFIFSLEVTGAFIVFKCSLERFKIHALATAIASASSGAVLAQQELIEQSLEEPIFVIGYRKSLEESINNKQFSDGIIDTINAEDIGKTTDQNIAEALSRITGVSMRTQDGEGTQVTIRGANAQQNVISFNGVQLPSNDASQAVDLSAFSADLLSKIEVIKTPSADHIEGSLGAHIRLSTLKPLTAEEDVAVVNLQARNNDQVDDTNFKASGAFTKKFLDDRLGILATAYTESLDVRRDQYSVDSYRASRPSSIATDTSGNPLTDVIGITPGRANYELYLVERSRQGVATDIQWVASDTTELSFFLSSNKQTVSNSVFGTHVLAPEFDNMVEGQSVPGIGVDTQSAWTDPQADWHVLDTKTNTFTRYLNRFSPGELSQTEQEYSNSNNLLSLNLLQELGPDIELDLGFDYSETSQTPERSNELLLQNKLRLGPQQLLFTSADEIEPVGIDCTSGRCLIVAGQGEINLGATDSTADNRSTTSFNPDDIESFHFATLERELDTVDDEIVALHADFDWALASGDITELEFGFRLTQREKRVDTQSVGYSNISPDLVIVDQETGEVIPHPNGITDLDARLALVGENLPADDFLTSLGYARDNVTDGWPAYSADKAFRTVLNTNNPEFIPNQSETRIAEIDTQAVYLKVNFASAADRVAGDIGLRYVSTDISTSGSSGVSFHSDPLGLGRVLDPFVLRSLRDPSNPACAPILFYNRDIDTENRFSRVDGLGYDTNNTADFADDTPIADQGACFDQNALRDSENYTSWWLWRHSDVSTEAQYIYEPRQIDENGNLVASENRALRVFEAKGEHSYNNILPSANLRLQLNDESVLRGAFSKTISRPEIDLLRPGFSLTETVFGGDNRTGNTVSLTNPQLEPLESTNVDLSFEWYKNNNTLVAVGAFFKDMSNFTEVEEGVVFVDDLRNQGGVEAGDVYDTASLILSANELEGCMPRRIQGGFGDELRQDWVFSENDEDLCAEFNATTVRNGENAQILGLEFQYSQVFTSLPGSLSGLGAQFNYTFQDSEFGAGASELNSDQVLPELPVPFTPRDTVNATVFWEKYGHQLRLAYQQTSDQLAQRSWSNGSIWQEGRSSLDFSAIYSITDNFSISFLARNLTDDAFRTYYTSRFLDLGFTDESGASVLFDEGNPIDGSASKSRTVSEYKTGASFSFGVQFRL